VNSLDISPRVAEHLRFYVYLYIDPRNDRVFYVGKGKGSRMLEHLRETGESEKIKLIRELHAEGLEPKLEILVHGLDDEADALRVEAAVIDLLGRDKLTNLVRGWGSKVVGRSSLAELKALYDAAPTDIDDAVLLIRINQLYRYGISAQELYEATRGVWKVGRRREGAGYACAVFRGVVREVYCVEGWSPAGSTRYFTRPAEEVQVPGRWEFTGHVAEPAVRTKYLDRSVMRYISGSARNPLKYINC
jgi:uncharacterized protein